MTTPAGPTEKNAAPLPLLTSLRFFAAAYVALFHYVPRTAEPEHLSWWINLIDHGYVGVSFFFVLSGFILAHNYMAQEFGVPPARRDFWIRRFARIYPSLAAATLLHLPLYAYALFHEGPFFPALTKGLVVTVLTFSMAQAWFPGLLGALNAPAWSISVEALFYAMFPWIMPWIFRMTVRTRVLFAAGACLACWIPAVLFQVSETRLFQDFPFWDGSPPTMLSVRTFLSAFPLVHLPQFMLGMAARSLVNDWRLPDAVHEHIHAALGAVFLAVIVILASLYTRSNSVGVALNGGALAPLFALAFMLVAWARKAPWPLLSCPPLLILGEASYSLYIFQSPVMAWNTLAWKKLSEWFPSFPNLGVFAGFTLLVAVSLWALRMEHAVRPRLVRLLTRACWSKPSAT